MSELVLQHLFEDAVERHGARPAVGLGDEVWSYSELDARAGRVAAWLAEQGIGRGALVALLVERSSDYVAAMWGILKAGAACLSLDPADPWPRLEATLRLAGATVAVARGDQVPGAAGELGMRVLDLRWDAPELARQPDDVPAVRGEPEDLAFVFYTSGSTGRPKGVMLSHATCSAFIPWVVRRFGASPEDRHVFRTTVSFVSVLRQVVWAHVTGGYAAVLPAGRERDLRAVAELVRDERVSLLGFIPSGFAHFLSHVERSEMSAVRHVLCGGEPLTKALQLTAFEKLDADIHNLYALSEAPLVMHWQCTPDDARPMAPMGDPIPGVEIALADREAGGGEEVAELYVGGVAAASGYLNAPELTAERFGPRAGDGDGTWLRTRDLVRRVDGVLEYAGRADSLVKVRGFRIEPGEVESALSAFPGIAQCVVTMWEPEAGDRRLVAYLVCEGERVPETAALRDFLRERVPSYMVPSLFIGVGAFPVQPNGKVDRGALPDPASAARDGGHVFVEPRDELEREAAELWQAVLRVPSVGAFDEFVDIGGESLLALEILEELQRRHGVEIPLEEFAEASTVAELAAVVRRARERS
ncbi:MAG: amino acid adenylation domain-containing protein [Actinomycetota bacterium]|nr:amino acid adenylation domain-containing protein [Actinomycetota bacterium]